MQMTGDAGFNEVFFDDVRVPRQNLVGELNQGWQVANATLAHERNMLGSTTRTQQMFNGLLRAGADAPALRQAGERRSGAAPAARRPDDPRRGDEVSLAAASSPTRLQAAAARHRRVGEQAGRRPSSTTTSRATALEVMGNYGPLARKLAHVVDRGIWPYEFMFTLGLIIGGGTSQIQKNIISERGLGMPQELKA